MVQKGLIVGGCGFIGSNIVTSIPEVDWAVIDNLSLGKIENLPKRDNIKFAKIDMFESQKLKEFITKSHRENPFDFFMLQNGPSSNPMYYPNPFRPYSELVLGTINIFDLARELDVNKVIYASTSSIYGGKKDPCSESEKIVPPNFYSVAKHSVEELSRVYYDTYGISSIGFRYFSVYGKKERHKGRFANIITQFIWDMLDGKRPVIYGDGSQTRDFTYVDDVVLANRMSLEYDRRGAHIFNVGTGRSNSFNDVVALINKALGQNIRPRYVENRISNYIAHTLADISKIKEEMGYAPRVGLEEGIRVLVDYYRTN